MPILIIQLAILVAVAFVIGCILGRLAKGKRATNKVREDTLVTAALSMPAIDEKPETVAPAKTELLVETKAKPVEAKAEQVEQANLPEDVNAELPAESNSVEEIVIDEEAIVEVEADRPQLLEAPLRGKQDDLTAINGIGKAIERKLQALGVFHYSQIAQWNVQEAGWIERNIGFAGRVTREEWVLQALKLSEAASKAVPKRRTKPKKATAKAKASARSKKKPD